MKTRSLLLLPLFWGALFLNAIPSHADEVFNNFDPGYSFFYGSGGAVAGTGTIGNTSIASQYFVPGQDYSLDQITMALSYDSDYPGANAAIITLNSDSGGQPGSVLMTWNVTDLPLTTPLVQFPPLTLDALSPLVLGAGQKYWIVASPGADPNTYDIWNFTNDAGTCTNGCQIPGQTYAFEVAGTPAAEVPEPGTSSLVETGLLGVCLAYFGRKSIKVRELS